MKNRQLEYCLLKRWTKYIHVRDVYCGLFSVLLPGEGRERGEKCFVYFRLPLRMFRSLLQSIDNQNVLGGRERREERE